ncbi:TPA: glycosyltransferase family 2 protein [Citrobacter gillenii]
MLVSIIITTRNSSSYIHKALDAIVSQTYKNYEVLVIDDASDDLIELEYIIKKYSHFFSIRIISQHKKTNASVARNIGIKNAKGDAVFFLDADDVWCDKKIETILSVIGNYRNEPIIIFHQSLRGTYSDIESGHAKVVPESGPTNTNIIDYLLNDNGVIQTSTISINKESAKILIFDESLPRHQDVQFCFDAYQKGVKFIFIEKVLSHWIILDRTVNAHVKGANVDFCLDWINKNRALLSEQNVINYLSNVLFYIAIKERRLLNAIPISFSLLGWKSLIAWNVFFVTFVKKALNKLNEKLKRFFKIQKRNFYV